MGKIGGDIILKFSAKFPIIFHEQLVY